MRNYEIMFIVRPTLSEDETKAVIKNFEGIITNNGGKLIDSKDMGKKELAYEIKDFTTGNYVLFTVEANDDKATKEFDRLALISKDVIRHLITRTETK